MMEDKSTIQKISKELVSRFYPDCLILYGGYLYKIQDKQHNKSSTKPDFLAVYNNKNNIKELAYEFGIEYKENLPFFLHTKVCDIPVKVGFGDKENYMINARLTKPVCVICEDREYLFKEASELQTAYSNIIRSVRQEYVEDAMLFSYDFLSMINVYSYLTYFESLYRLLLPRDIKRVKNMRNTFFFFPSFINQMREIYKEIKENKKEEGLRDLYIFIKKIIKRNAINLSYLVYSTNNTPSEDESFSVVKYMIRKIKEIR